MNQMNFSADICILMRVGLILPNVIQFGLFGWRVNATTMAMYNMPFMAHAVQVRVEVRSVTIGSHHLFF